MQAKVNSNVHMSFQADVYNAGVSRGVYINNRVSLNHVHDRVNRIYIWNV